MKKIAIGTIATVMLFGAGFTLAKDQTFTGEIYDSQCAKDGSHAKMMAKEGMAGKENDPMGRAMCTNNCVKKMGAKYVLFNSAKKTIYELDDQQKPEQFAGKNVKVKGTYDKATKTIHVTSVEAAS
jgi:hypothetical protein